MDICADFDREYTDALERLTMMTRGVGDPLVAVYLRCYLCRVSPCEMLPVQSESM